LKIGLNSYLFCCLLICFFGQQLMGAGIKYLPVLISSCFYCIAPGSIINHCIFFKAENKALIITFFKNKADIESVNFIFKFSHRNKSKALLQKGF